MSETIHKFYCAHCRSFVLASTEVLLTSRVNRHNEKHHPFESSNWNPTGLLMSCNYYVESDGPRVKVPADPSEWGNAAHAPDITLADRELLAKGNVRW